MPKKGFSILRLLVDLGSKKDEPKFTLPSAEVQFEPQ